MQYTTRVVPVVNVIDFAWQVVPYGFGFVVSWRDGEEQKVWWGHIAEVPSVTPRKAEYFGERIDGVWQYFLERGLPACRESSFPPPPSVEIEFARQMARPHFVAPPPPPTAAAAAIGSQGTAVASATPPPPPQPRPKPAGRRATIAEETPAQSQQRVTPSQSPAPRRSTAAITPASPQPPKRSREETPQAPTEPAAHKAAPFPAPAASGPAAPAPAALASSVLAAPAPAAHTAPASPAAAVPHAASPARTGAPTLASPTPLQFCCDVAPCDGRLVHVVGRLAFVVEKQGTDNAQHARTSEIVVACGLIDMTPDGCYIKVSIVGPQLATADCISRLRQMVGQVVVMQNLLVHAIQVTKRTDAAIFGWNAHDLKYTDKTVCAVAALSKQSLFRHVEECTEVQRDLLPRFVRSFLAEVLGHGETVKKSDGKNKRSLYVRAPWGDQWLSLSEGCDVAFSRYAFAVGEKFVFYNFVRLDAYKSLFTTSFSTLMPSTRDMPAAIEAAEDQPQQPEPEVRLASQGALEDFLGQ